MDVNVVDIILYDTLFDYDLFNECKDLLYLENILIMIQLMWIEMSDQRFI